MKKIILTKQILKIFFGFVLTLSILNSKAQTSVYHPFPDSNAVWNGSYYFSAAPNSLTEDYSYVMAGDTIIGSKTYHKIYIPYVQKTGDTTLPKLHIPGYQGCVRHDTSTRQVFYLELGSSLERLLYDFSLHLGDPVRVFNTQYGGMGGNFVVRLMDSVLVGSDYRKRWVCGDTNFYVSWSYIEGIGNREGLLDIECESGRVCLDPVSSVGLNCFKQNDTVLYHPNSSASCDVITSVKNNETGTQSAGIFPNPASHKITINGYHLSGKSLTLEIHNILGEKVFQSKITDPKSEISIDISELNAGIYLVTLSDEEKIYRGKLVKK